MTEILLIVIPSAISSTITWLFTRRKNRAEASSNEVQNVEHVARLWRELAEDIEKRLKKEVDELRQENTKIKNSIRELVEENKGLQKQIVNLVEENKGLIEQMENLDKQLKAARCDNKRMINELKAFNKNYAEVK